MWAGFCAPLCFSVKKGPSRKMPCTRAPRKPSPRSSTASRTEAQASPIWSSGWVRVVGSQEVVPCLASSRLATFTPSGLQSMMS